MTRMLLSPSSTIINPLLITLLTSAICSRCIISANVTPAQNTSSATTNNQFVATQQSTKPLIATSQPLNQNVTSIVAIASQQLPSGAQNSSQPQDQQHNEQQPAKKPNEQYKPQQNQQQQPPRRQQPADDEYLVGVGIADITGPAADINLVSLIQRLAASSVPQFLAPTAGSETSNVEELFRIQYPSWRDLTDVKLQLKINFKSLLLQTPMMNNIIRWAMPNQIKMQAEYTYANLVVQL